MKKHILLLFLLVGGSLAVKSQSTDNVDLMFPNLMMTRYHYDKMKEDIEKKGNNPPKSAYIKQMRNPAESIVNNDRKTTTAVSTSNNPANIEIKDEMNAIYQLCVVYVFSQEEKFLNKAVEYLKAWGKVNVAVSKSNIHESVYTPAVEGYSIIRNVISQEDREEIDSWFRKRVNVFIKDNDLRENNWGTCLHQQFYHYGLALNDKTVIDYFKNRYPAWVKNNLYPNGTTTDLLGRDAFAYHAYDLLFFAEICHAIACYEGYEAADEFYARDVNWGASIKKSVDFWKPYLLDPAKNPHLEFVETEWAPDKQRSDYNKPYNPGGTMYAADEIFEMDHDLIRAVEKYRGGNPFYTWRLTLSNLRWYYGTGEQ
ncbi:alginate lyase family protein [Bacteroides sp. HPS0048]|uniref:alginate lyase family protein n=1 Tax=Bacteroides sp. HPS0048 TaxID=1078089 RepID=UPI00356503C4